MRKIITTCLLIAGLIAGTSTYAQGLSLGVKAGLNLSNIGGDDAPGMFDPKIGFQFGIVADYDLNDFFYLSSGLELTQKGTRYKIADEKIKVRPLYLQLPVHIGYKLELSSFDLLFEAGPYLAVGLGGKVKGDDDDFKYFDKDNETRRFDFGLGAAVGAEFGAIGVKLGYDWGLVKTDKSDFEAKLFNRNGYLALIFKL